MDEYLVAVNRELRKLVQAPDRTYASYYGMLQYHLGWVDADFNAVDVDPGKRLRPLLSLLSCEAVSGEWEPALPVAVAIELAHNFSLIHDDIEDRSDARRGRPAVWKVWGLAQGLNAGDGMFVLARLALDRLRHQGLPVEKRTALNTIFDEATLALCQGQFLDLGFESRLDVTVDEYLEMIRGKTAALISAATRLGAMVRTDNPGLLGPLARFGENVGLSFQIADDILGIWGDPSITGKSAATDVLAKKKSLPAIFGLTHREVGPRLRQIYGQETLREQDVEQVLGLLDAAGAREYAQEKADGFRTAALAALDETGLKNRPTDQLREIAQRMTRRDR